MTQTVRIDETTHALLKQLADADQVTMQEELARAVQARRRERFFAQMTAGYLDRSSDEVREDEAETALWDGASSDGLDKE
jgi:hypothetical protein